MAQPKYQNSVFNSANAGNGLNSVSPQFIDWAEAPASAWPYLEREPRRRQFKLDEVIRVGPLPVALVCVRDPGTLPPLHGRQRSREHSRHRVCARRREPPQETEPRRNWVSGVSRTVRTRR